MARSLTVDTSIVHGHVQMFKVKKCTCIMRRPDTYFILFVIVFDFIWPILNAAGLLEVRHIGTGLGYPL